MLLDALKYIKKDGQVVYHKNPVCSSTREDITSKKSVSHTVKSKRGEEKCKDI